MNSTGKFEEFEKLWADSLRRAEIKPDWGDMTLAEQKWTSSQFRKEMDRYGEEVPIAEIRMGTGPYVLPTSSRESGSPPGGEPGDGD